MKCYTKIFIVTLFVLAKLRMEVIPIRGSQVNKLWYIKSEISTAIKKDEAALRVLAWNNPPYIKP